MNIKQLKEYIKDLPDDMKVVLQGDSEGNYFNNAFDLDSNCVFDEHNNFYSLDWTADLACKSKSEWNEIKKLPKTLVISP
jgi:hypothetical protein